MLIATVLLPFAFHSRFDYLVPPEWAAQAEAGKRVLVPFRKNDTSTGVILSVLETERITQGRKIKFIQEILDEQPIIGPNLRNLYQWIAEYYLCSEGEVLQASLPRGLKIQYEMRVRPIAQISEVIIDGRLTDDQYLILEALELQKELLGPQIRDLLRDKKPESILKPMADRGWIRVDRYKQNPVGNRTIAVALWRNPPQNETDFLAMIDSLRNAPKQQEILKHLFELPNPGVMFQEKKMSEELGIATGIFQGLEKKGILERMQVPINRVQAAERAAHKKDIRLTPAQNRALQEIRSSIAENRSRPVLLLGITGSGKTHLYIELIRETLEQGKLVLYLLPEIGLTKQIIDRLFAEFGEQVGVYHSRFSDAERVEIWQRILDGSYRIVIGVRSALLLPLENLGLIVVDEEHDSSFKQQERNPRYHARDAAVYFSRTLNIPLVLGTATPSVESYYNAVNGRYSLVRLDERIHGLQLPEVEFVDMSEQFANQLSHGQFSDKLIAELQGVLARNEQAIIFNHRRAYAPFVICTQCGHVPKCINCDISLSYHKARQTLTCHYCGYGTENTEKCEVCQGYTIRHEGIGTERIVEQLQEMIPEARIDRMDLDTTRGKHAFENLIGRFERHEVDFLIGTRMVTKGLDFERVSLAAVVQADRLLHFPDFRAHEYAYQLLTQFCGRAGRSQTGGKVLIQTLQTDHPILQLLQKPYDLFYQQEIVSRAQPVFPPFSRLILMEIEHADRAYLEQEGRKLGNAFRDSFQGIMLGPEYPMIPRLRNKYRLQILLKIKQGMSPTKVKIRIRELVDAYYQGAPNKTLRISYDVDPR